MTDPRITKLANLLTNYSVKVQPGDTVGIRASVNGLPLALEVYRAVLAAGGLPMVLWQESAFDEILLKEGNAEQLAFVSPAEREVVEKFDCRITIRSEANTRIFSNIEAARQTERRSALRGMTETFMRRSSSGAFRWVGAIFPSQAHAQDADMSLAEYENFVYGACHVDKEDPVAEWLALSAMQQKLVDYLAGKKEVRVVGPNAELTLSIEGRTFVNSDGQKNMPSGEIFTGPVEESVNGWVRYTFPAIYSGREVEGIELRFEDGKVVDASARKNEAFLISVLDTDAGSRYLGEFAIGTNSGIQQFTRSILFDEKIGGTLHMAVGASYPETGGRNQSAVHWDMICDMRAGGQIFVDGELFYDSGRFTVLS